MSQLLSRIAKLSSSSIGKQGLCFSESRFFSTRPYLLFMDSNRRGGASDETVMVDMNLYDPRKEERVKIPDQTRSNQLFHSTRIGSSKGWVAMKNMDESTMCVTNVFNPSASVSSHKVISLPPLDSTRFCPSRFCLSASPNEKEDCVGAVTSSGSSVSLCRPGDSEWTRVKVPFLASDLMYSERDRRFYLYRDDEYDGQIDLMDTSCSNFPQVSLHQSFPSSEIPESRRVKSSFTTKHLVKSPSGDSFIVHWYEDLSRGDGSPYKNSRMVTRGFVVSRQDPEQRMSCYTQEIGDLCIFLGQQNEAFCVSSTEYPGIKPNSIYFASADMGFRFYDLSSGTFHGELNPPTSPTPCLWLAPLQ